MMPRERGLGLYVVPIAAGLSWLATPGCGGLTAEQRAALAKVQVMTGEPAVDCQNLGLVTGSIESGGPHGARAKAVILGGNTLRVDAHGVVMAFYCPPRPVNLGPTQ